MAREHDLEEKEKELNTQLKKKTVVFVCLLMVAFAPVARSQDQSSTTDVAGVTKRQPASELAVAIHEAFEGHIFLSAREMASQVISHHLSQATVALLMSTNRLLAHDVLLLQHREQTASSIVEERNE